MKITNHAGIHELLVAAIERQDERWYAGKNEERFASATQLLKPPYMMVLEKEHGEELEQEAVDCIWRLFGAAVHKVAELGSESSAFIAEPRFAITVNGKRITGGADAILRNRKIVDFKVTSAWTLVYGSRVKEWEAQLNIYAEMAQQAGYPIDALEVIAILRDWSAKSKRDSGADYPESAVVTIPIGLWVPERINAFLRERVAALEEAMTHGCPSCTPEERWEKPTTWAVKKKGAKRATKVCSTQEEAEACLSTLST